MRSHVKIVCSLGFLCASVALIAQAPKPLPYMDPSLPTEKRVDDLVSRMTLDEKVTQTINT